MMKLLVSDVLIDRSSRVLRQKKRLMGRCLLLVVSVPSGAGETAKKVIDITLQIV